MEDTKFFNDDELIAAINHSSSPYIIVEGKHDLIIYREILNDIDCVSALEPRGGCQKVQALIKRKNEITNPNVIFILDKDILVYKKEVPNIDKVLYTEGYSIENDLYQGRAFEKKYFNPEDKKNFEKLLDSFILYYACELEKFFKGKKSILSKMPDSIINKSDYSLNTSLLVEYNEPSQKTVDYLKNEYDLLLRGHSLFNLVEMVMRKKGRKNKFNSQRLYEICYRLKSNSIKNMQARIKKILTDKTVN